MPKIKKVAAKVKKQKLSPAERSQIAKDRWAKKRSAQEATLGVDTSIQEVDPVVAIVPTPPTPEQSPVAPESRTLLSITEEQSKIMLSHPLLSPQLVPVAPKKTKRIPVPKEFLTALKTADSLLAKAIEEYEDCQRRITYLSGSIPRLQRTVLALRNESNPDIPVAPYNAFNPAALYNSPQLNPPPAMPQPYVDPLAAIQGAAAAPPVSRAQGGAMQFSPEMLGTLEGPEDDDPDRFISGPNAGGGWIGG